MPDEFKQKPLLLDDFEQFVEFTGIITDSKVLKLINAPEGYDDDCGRYDNCREALPHLYAFVQKNSTFHIVTMTSESDEAEAQETMRLYLAKTGKNWDDATDDEKDDFQDKYNLSASVYDNQVRIVNRLAYFLANGSTAPCVCTEIHRFYEESEANN